MTLAAVLALDGSACAPTEADRRLLRGMTKARLHFGSPRPNTALLKSGAVTELVVLWRAEVAVGARRKTLAEPFLPAGKRLGFRLVDWRETPRGAAARYVAR